MACRIYPSAVLVAAWMILAKPLKTKTATLEAENAELKVKAEEYEAVNAQRTVYEEEAVDKIIEGFLVGVN